MMQDRLKKIMADRKITMYSLSMMSDVSYGKIYQIFHGHRIENTRLETYYKLAAALGLHILDVFPEINIKLEKYRVKLIRLK